LALEKFDIICNGENMRTPILSILITILLIFVSNCVNSKESTMITARKVEFSIDNSSLISKTVDEKWEPAVFKEIKVGVNLRSDAIKILGKPDSSTDSDQNDLPIDNDNADANILDIYSNFAFYGELTVISSKKNGVVIQIESHPNNLPVEDAIKMWGNDYRKTKYDFAVCPNDAGSSAIYFCKSTNRSPFFSTLL